MKFNEIPCRLWPNTSRMETRNDFLYHFEDGMTRGRFQGLRVSELMAGETNWNTDQLERTPNDKITHRGRFSPLSTPNSQHHRKSET